VTENVPPTPAAPAYATGGGGTVLEHRYGAVLLAHLLTGDPVPMLGPDATPTSVRFQASPFSAVDDLLVEGRTPDGGLRRVSVGVRRAPSLTASDEPSVGLLASYLRIVTERWEEVRAGRWRLGLAVASPNTAIQQMRELAMIARSTPDEAAFRAEVGQPGRTNQGVRDRLRHLDDLVRASRAASGSGSEVDAGELTWRLLSALNLTELRLEGADDTDRTSAIARLRPTTHEGTGAASDALFSRLAELARRYAPAGAEITESMLRRDLSGTSLARSRSYAKAWEILDALTARLRNRTGFRLEDRTGQLELERAGAREALITDLTRVANGSASLVVVGEPDVGKSALTLRAAELIQATAVVVTSLSLRDLPPTVVEFEALLGGPIAHVLEGTATASGRLLVIDGAESVLEGRAPLLIDMATAAFRAGLGVVAVTRRDGAPAVTDALHRAATAAGVSDPPREYEIPALTPKETQTLAATFTSLRRLAEEPRAAWLLARLGLVDLLLRAGAVGDLPAGPLSEAEVFAAVWHQLVRRAEVSLPGGPSPDARERALTSLARGLLLPDDPGQPPDADALPSLRSDGLLLPPGPTSAWTPADQFASDLLRDLAVARLLITQGWDLLDRAGAPRWALRAVRLACQSTLAGAGSDSEGARIPLQATFDDLAKRHGERWAELPSEAMLTLGSARDVLARAWPALLEDDRSTLRMLLRLALQRYCEHGFGDPVVLTPLVELTYLGEEDLGQDDRYARRGIGEQVRELVQAWLRGLVNTDVGPLVLRQQVRDRLLSTDPEPYDEFAVEALAMLGPDLDDRAKEFLLGVAGDRGGHLAPAVEMIGPLLAMSTHQPELLMTLTEAYYIERHEEDPYGWSSSALDDGIRHHQKTPHGLGVPMAAWYFGPFFRLLNVRPVETAAMINRMLDHAAAVRVGHLNSLDGGTTDDASALPGLDLDLPGAGSRRCVGDPHVWSWYRGSSVGPYPCMSALLAVERFADHLVDALGVPLEKVVELLLRDCHNLAMPGLVVGLLVRHLDRAGVLMDRWVVQPELWRLEFSRAATEGRLHVQGPDAPDLVGRDRRRYSFRDVAAETTLRAMGAGDGARLATLAGLADELVERARALIGDGPDTSEEMATVEGWAATFRPENYRAERAEDGGVIIQYEHPEEVASALAPGMASLARGNDAIRLQMKYAQAEDRVAPADTLTDDLALAKDLAERPPEHGPLDPADPVAAVAAAAVLAHAQGRAAVPDDDLRWAADVLVEVAMSPQHDHMSFESSTYPWGADRSAAVGLPSLLLPAFDGIGLDRPKVEEALRECTTSLFDEVRASFGVGVRPVWAAPCEEAAGSATCRHEAAWAAVQEGLRDCRLGDWNPGAQRRLPDPLDGPYEQTLPGVETERLLVNRLTHPLVAAADAGRSASCVADSARRLLDVLYDAHRRGSDHWARKGYGEFNDRLRPRVAQVLVEAAVAGDPGPLTEYVRAFVSNARALDRLLRDLAELFTYEDALRPSLPAVWREVMTAALDAVDEGADLLGDRHWSDGAVAGLLPTPQLDTGDSDPDATMDRAKRGWVDPDTIEDLILRWIGIARREPRAVDAFLQLARSASPHWQARTGIALIEDLIDGDYSAVAARCWFLPDWLGEVRASGQLDAEGEARWRRIVDGLAAEGDSRAVGLQKAEE
jgi:hypothetical protein